MFVELWDNYALALVLPVYSFNIFQTSWITTQEYNNTFFLVIFVWISLLCVQRRSIKFMICDM